MQPGSLSFANIAEKLAVLSQQRATGELILSSVDNQWHLYFFLGRLLYATGDVHRVRRWHRAVMQDCPGLKLHAPHLTENEFWEYYLLEEGISQNRLTLTQAKSIVSKIVHEVLFTLIGHSNLRSFWLPKKIHPIALLEVKEALQTSVELWTQWQKMGLGKLCPDTAPIFKSISSESVKTSKTFFSLSQLVNGENTIWDIALQTKQSVTTMASVIQNLANQDVLELLPVADFPIPVAVSSSSPSIEKQSQPSTAASGSRVLTPSSQRLSNSPTKTHRQQTPQLKKLTKDEESNFVHSAHVTHALSTFNPPSVSLVSPEETRSLIAYIDDSPSDSMTMGAILTQAGYRFINVQNPVTALPILLEHKPSLIFLDLVMPIANGYEICSQIRRVSVFKNTPVIIVTSNDGIIDRVRAKMVGSSGFLAKPITAEKVLTVLQKSLPTLIPMPSPEATNSSSLLCKLAN
ncbi:response regulator [Nostocales cyanobacterium HT-58-2]|nr:response regulator [Nostocales cyanobacterium HT-58-2]